MHYLFHSTPTATFKSRTQNITAINQPCSTPGPADYQIKKPLPQPRTVSRITQQRNLYNQKNQNPGPGTYEPKSYIQQGLKKSISARLFEHTKKSPSPQDYMAERVSLQNKAPVYSLGKKSKSIRQIDFDHNTYKPAPTNYPTKDPFQLPNKIIMGTSNRKDLTETEKTPAPNSYQITTAVDIASITNPSFKFGEQSRNTSFNKKQNNPSPNLYNITSFIDQNLSQRKGFSCRIKTANLASIELSKMPAPGQYQVNFSNKNQAPRCSVSSNKRSTFMDDMQKFKQEFPGPGAHQPLFKGTKYKSMSVTKFSKSPRKQLDQNEKTPGPLQYKNQKIHLLKLAPKYSVSKKASLDQFLIANPQHPGPGNYDPKLQLIKSKTLISEVPKQKRPDFQHHRHTPGPGFYNLRGKEQGPTWKFSHQKRIAFTDHKNEAKNGVFYELQSKVVDPPSYMKVDSKLKFSQTKSSLEHKL